MNQTSQHDIDQVLTALRNTTPPTGMESRILKAVEQRTASLPSQLPARTWTWAFGAAALITALALTAIHLHRNPPSDPVSTASTNHATPTPPLQAASVTNRHLPKPSPSPQPNKITRRSAPLCDCDPLALAESNAPSLPAPEMPLTAQEKLLLRVAQHPDPVQIEQFDLVVKAARDAEEKAQFQKFFNHPTPGDNE